MEPHICPYGVPKTPKTRSGGALSFITLLHSVSLTNQGVTYIFTTNKDMTSDNSHVTVIRIFLHIWN